MVHSRTWEYDPGCPYEWGGLARLTWASLSCLHPPFEKDGVQVFVSGLTLRFNYELGTTYCGLLENEEKLRVY